MKLKEVSKVTGKSGRIKIERKSLPIDNPNSMLNYQRDIDMAFVEEKSRNDIQKQLKISEDTQKQKIIIITTTPSPPYSHQKEKQNYDN